MTFCLKFISLVATKSITSAPIVDGIIGDTSIANFWHSKFEQLLNTSRTHDADLLVDKLDHRQPQTMFMKS